MGTLCRSWGSNSSTSISCAISLAPLFNFSGRVSYSPGWPQTYYIAKGSLKHLILLSQPSKPWDYMCATVPEMSGMLSKLNGFKKKKRFGPIAKRHRMQGLSGDGKQATPDIRTSGHQDMFSF